MRLWNSNPNSMSIHTKKIQKTDQPSKRKWIAISGVLILMMLLTGCVPGDGTYSAADPAGFFWGVWHGWIAPVSLIVGLFNDTWRVYEPFNTGWWYDFGFYIAIISGFGSISLRRRKRD